MLVAACYLLQDGVFMIDTTERDALKQRLDCRVVAERTLGPPARQSPKAWHWMCPYHDDRDPSLAVWSDGWLCFGCGASGDVYDLIMREEGCDFPAAHEWLKAHAGELTVVGAPSYRNRSAGRDSRREEWRDPRWQRSKRRLVEVAAMRLHSPAGEQGRAYLAHRGISPQTAQVWSLGYVSDVTRWQKGGAGQWHSESMGPAIVLPWKDGELVKAVQYRLLEHHQRYHQEARGERTLFGAEHIAGASTLILVEGELNAVSIWHAAADLVDVVSFGPEGNVDRARDYLRRLADRYGQVLVWADKAEVSRLAERTAGANRALMSPTDDSDPTAPTKLDANSLLVRGELRAFLEVVLQRIRSSQLSDAEADRRFQELLATGQQNILSQFNTFSELEIRCGELHGLLVANPQDSMILGQYDSYATAWELCRGLVKPSDN